MNGLSKVGYVKVEATEGGILKAVAWFGFEILKNRVDKKLRYKVYTFQLSMF